MITVKNCPVCNSIKQAVYLNSKDHFLSKEPFSIVECLECKFKFTNPHPNLNDLQRYYQSEDYISHSNSNKGIISKLYQWVRTYTLSTKEKLLRSYVSRGTLLDYGCGSGHFIAYCQSKKWKVAGVEPDDGARSIAKQSLGSVYKTKEDLMLNESQKQYSAITLWHVLEHLPDLESVMEFIKKSLEKHGVLFVALPNPNSYDAKKYREYWAAWDLPRHLYHFDRSSIVNFMAKYGFQVIAIKPMYFDSFYVSMLSEKYLKGNTNVLKAAITGAISNLKAIRSGEYSSLIYILRKA